MKKFGFMLLLLLFVLALPLTGHAASGSNKIILDGKELTAGQNVPVENVNSSVMVPLRMIAENLGYGVDWNQTSKTVTISQSGKALQLVVGQTTATVDDKAVTLTAAPVLRNGTTLVPIRFVGEGFGLKVDWDNTNKVVTLITPTTANDNSMPPVSAPGSSGSAVSGLAKVTGISFNENKLLIAMEGSAEPKVTVLTGPDRIAVDLPNATFSETFGTGQALDSNLNGRLDVSGYPDITGVRYSLFSSSPYTVRFVLDLNYAKNYAINVTGDTTKLVTVDLNVSGQAPGVQAPVPAAPAPGAGGKKLVVLDAGHGAKDPGAKGVTGKYEKNFNLAVVLKAAELLRKESKIEVVLTRSDDTFLELKERAAIANSLKADLFVSVHANSSSSSAASGTETYYQKASSKELATVMHKYLVKASGLSDRGVRYGNFHVIRETTMPAVLLEIGYLSNKKDEALLFTEALQNRVAQAMVSGIKEYLKL